MRKIISDSLAATDYGVTGFDFVVFLSASKYEEAHAMLSSQLKHELTATKLKEKFEQMIMHGVVTHVEALEGYDNYPNKLENDIGGVYVSVSGHDRNDPMITYNEAVMVFVSRENTCVCVREIIWGRP